MTITVTVSINAKVENEEGKILQSCIRADRLEEDLKGLNQQLIEILGEMVLASFEEKLKVGKYREGVSIRTEARRY